MASFLPIHNVRCHPEQLANPPAIICFWWKLAARLVGTEQKPAGDIVGPNSVRNNTLAGNCLVAFQVGGLPLVFSFRRERRVLRPIHSMLCSQGLSICLQEARPFFALGNCPPQNHPHPAWASKKFANPIAFGVGDLWGGKIVALKPTPLPGNYPQRRSAASKGNRSEHLFWTCHFLQPTNPP